MVLAVGVLAAVGCGAAPSAFAGSLVGWGVNWQNDRGQANPPAGSDYVAVASGDQHSIAIKADGSLVGWGANFFGQTSVPPGDDYVAVSAGDAHSVALKRDGSLVAWGHPPASAPPGNDFAAVGAGAHFDVALKRDGSLLAWGTNDHGQTIVPAGNDYVAISSGAFFGVALRRNGSLVAWGEGSHGETVVPAGNDYVAISASGFHTVARKRDGSLTAWGWNDNGETNVPAGNRFAAVAAGSWHNIAIVDGTPPSVTVPGTITVPAISSTPVTYAVSANDDMAGPVTPVCTPPSGSVFAIGTTTVTCIAADAVGNQASASFKVVVTGCALNLTSPKVLVQPSRRKAARKRYARVLLTASCPQVARARLAGRVTFRTRSTRGHRARTNVVRLAPVTVKLKATRTTALALKLPSRALTALRQRARVRGDFTLTATTASARGVVRTQAARLKAVRR
jgi:hypothetical protein